MEQDPDLPEKIRSDLLLMTRNLQLEAQLIDDLLDLTRISKGKISLQSEVTDVHSLIRSVSQLCQGEIAKQQLSFEMHLEAPRYYVRGDPGRIQQVLWNLLNNAVKFATLGGRIELRTSVVAGKELRIQFADDGRGIEPELLQRIFQPFDQGDISVHQFGGLGLGLAISKFIIDAHQGKIWAESPGLGQGATFTISLPLAELEQAPAVAIPGPKPAARRAARILLVDDHEDTLEVMRRFLRRGGHQVVTASTFQQALSIGQLEKFDLLISDLGLADGNGYELISALKAVSSVKGIALSGYGMKSDVDRSMSAGFSAHLIKPCSPSILNATIEKVLS
jgi:CheY-like chemotaxis protein